VKPVLVIEQEVRLAGQGVLGERLQASGLPVRTLRAWEEGLDGLGATDFAGVIPLGSNVSAWQEDRHPFLRPQRELLAEAVEQDVPVLGICLGAQLLARALGGNVYRGEEYEIGWLPIHPSGVAGRDPVLGHLSRPTGVFQFHLDTFSLPEGSVLLASSERFPNQAFRYRQAWGVQFHPEVDNRQFSIWIDNHPGDAEKLGFDEGKLRREVARHADSVEARTFRTRLFDAFLGLVRNGA
jgi:GMP synthase (glutamine-hydrolysing)